MFKSMKSKLLCFVFTFMLLVSSIAYANPISDNISTDNMYSHLVQIANIDNARVTGTQGEHLTADYIAQEFEKYGLSVEKQQFPITAKLDSASCTMIDPENKSFTSKNFAYTPSTPHNGLTAELVYANLGSSSDFSNIDVQGKIALIKRGSYSFYDKTQNAAKAGAIGVIIFNNSFGMITSGTLNQATDIPAIALSDTDGNYLKSKLSSGESVTVTMHADNINEESYSQNIIGTLQSAKENAQTIVVGAHYDCVDTPGANDNGSGTVSLLEIARVLSAENLNYNIKFISFGAEEVGLIGSQKYIRSLSQSELDNIYCMINLDMVGVGDTLGIFTSKSSARSFIADLTEQYASNLGISYNRKAIDRSDHAPFEAVGIPVSFLMYEEDHNYHTDLDTISNIQVEDLKNTCTIVTSMIADMGTPSYKMLESENNIKNSLEKESPVKENKYDKSKLDEYNFENTEFFTE